MAGGGIGADALVLYKTRPALVKNLADGKITISISNGEELKVRERDIELIHPGPLKSLSALENAKEASESAVREAWELLLADGGGPFHIKELTELVFGEYSPQNTWAAFCLLTNGLYFCGNAAAITCRRQDEVADEEKKSEEKQKEAGERELFLKRLKSRGKEPLLPEDARFMQDVEALAFGKSSKSRTMKEIGLGETPEDAHALLLDTGFWTNSVNPYPARFGLSLAAAKHGPGTIAGEIFAQNCAQDRVDLTSLAAFAIDNSWSNDPDDAVSIETGGERQAVLYVHVADPAAVITPDSPAEKDARDRGATLYLPEGNFTMLNEEFLPIFALGLGEISPALTFKITLDQSAAVVDAEIFPSMVKVRRLSYENADKLLDGSLSGGAEDICALRSLEALAERNFARRSSLGAVNIDLSEVHISVKDGVPVIQPLKQFRSASLVRECMLLAGEGACFWAAKSGGAAFPYASQEAGDLPDEILPGMAGSYQLRRCMKPRILSTKPGSHAGLGLAAYTQVTSPLRRYGDLLAHLQIRAVLRGTPPISAEELALRLGAGEAAAMASSQAERASRLHWTCVYLSEKTGSQWDAVALEKKGARWIFMIPDIALETQAALRKDVLPNEPVKLVLKAVNIPKGEIMFTALE